LTPKAPSPAPATPSSDRRAPDGEPSRWPWALFGSLFAVVAALTCFYELTPGSFHNPAAPFAWSDTQRDVLTLSLLCLATLGLLVACIPRKAQLSARSQRTLAVVLGALTWLSGVSYFYGAHGAKPNYSHLHDSYHYLLGAKYYAELGYDQLYVCTAQATSRARVPDSTDARDLRNDRSVRVRDLRDEPSCRARFSPARWEEFQSDLDVFLDIEAYTVRRVVRDRGYNGAPLQAFIAGSIANAIPLDYATLSLVTLFDVFSLCLMLAVLCQAFGWRIGLLCALLFFTEYVDRFLIIGGSFMRYQWLAALGLGIAWLKEERYGRAGAALAVASALNVFPVLFAGAMVVKAAVDLVRRRGLSRPQKRFFGGALGAGALCLALGAAHAGGLDNYVQFAEAMRVHNAAGRVPGFGVGIKYDFVPSAWDGSLSGKKRERALREMRPVIAVCAGILLLLLAALVPLLDDVEGAVLCGFAGLFCVFGPTGYYFAFAALLVLVWHRRLYDSGGRWALFALFALSLPPMVVILLGAHRYFVFNRVVSACWTLYLVGTLGYLAYRERLFGRLRQRGASPVDAVSAERPAST
jgi:hypothetical protein